MKRTVYTCDLCGSTEDVIGITSFEMGEYDGYHYFYEADNIDHCQFHICKYCLSKFRFAFKENKL
jgi:hypothetical protein